MKTFHTDFAYTGFSMEPEAHISLVSETDSRRTLVSENDQTEAANHNAKVIVSVSTLVSFVPGAFWQKAKYMQSCNRITALSMHG